ncbi:hypothetical protein SAMN06265371_106198 [Lutibacter agarilyticus]|uniref:Uncharacterized protein n=1 Tax=Lutibacter agarilyticus TaxID=1109740 RepID=A0A238XPH4_9FLAO|nr:hypothetical protein [Lutibacter agarilyticus]SNR60478.1 hypothetical protein SAMN06265371_106198 [Lutibacter agarilyticus]
MISFLLIIPWLIFGFFKSKETFIGLNQTKLSLILLIITELIFFLILLFSLPEPNHKLVGLSSFSWTYLMIYTKGIIPTWFIAELMEGTLGDKIDTDYQFTYLIISLIIDYFLLFMISPRLLKIFRMKKPVPNNS